MNCTESENYIYNDPEPDPGDLRKTEFLKHLDSCASCRAEYENASKYFNLISRLQKNTPQLDHPQIFTDTVLGEIGNFRPGWSLPAVSRFIRLVPVRYAAAIILLTIGYFYFYEEYSSSQRVSALEKKYGLQTELRMKEMRNASTFPGIYDLLGGGKNYFRLPGEWMMIKKSEVVLLLEQYGLYTANQISSAKFESELKKYFSDQEVKILLNDKNEVEKLIDRAIPGSEDKHEK